MKKTFGSDYKLILEFSHFENTKVVIDAFSTFIIHDETAQRAMKILSHLRSRAEAGDEVAQEFLTGIDWNAVMNRIA